MKNILILLLLPLQLMGQEISSSEVFWNTLKTHCKKSYAGEIVAGGVEGDRFTGKKLVMHVRSCKENIIRIPFFVGEDKSRTWVFKINNEKIISLKHDHRHKNGVEDKITQYGGLSTNAGLSNIQVFHADGYTGSLIPAASTNVWWVTIDENFFTYNLRRIGSDRFFSVKFDLTNEVVTPTAPWGFVD